MNTGPRELVRYLRKTNLVWRYGSNLSSSVNYNFGAKDLNRIESEIEASLTTNGIAIASVDQLLDDQYEYHSLNSSVADLLRSRRREIEKLKSKANDETEIGKKTFNVEFLESESLFDTESIFTRFALNNALLNIANAYFRMHVKLRYYNVWYTFASESTARESQLWHFDREDNYILKVFLYLDDVDEGAGPFTYAPGTHKKGKYRNIKPEFFMEGGVRRTTDDQMKAVFPEDKWVCAVGKKGTIIFADTRGYHKGGEARTKDRLMFTCMYTSQASESKRLINYPKDLDLSTLTPKQIRALQHK